MERSYYNLCELSDLGLKSYGKNVLLSKKASIYNPEKIIIGDNVRIDDFCILSGHIEIGDYIHISAFCALYGGEPGIYVNDFSTISSRISVYAISDDYSGDTLTNPMIPRKFRHVTEAPVIFCKHSIVGASSIILPGVIIAEGCSIGAMSLVNKSTEAWGIYAGIPAKRIKERSQKLLEFEKALIDERIKHE